MLAELDLQKKLDSNGIEQKVSSGEHKGAGISCNYYPLGGGLGLKIYYGRKSLKRRENNYMMQEHMYKLGFAPKVYNKVQIGELYGFVTEECSICSNMHYTLNVREGRDAARRFDNDFNNAIEALEQKLPDYITACDTGMRNCGYNNAAELVFVDLGNFAVDDCVDCVDDCDTETLQIMLDKYL